MSHRVCARLPFWRSSASLLLVGILSMAASVASAADSRLQDSLAAIAHDWAITYFEAPEAKKTKDFSEMASRCDWLQAQHPQSIEARVWHGIVLASAAEFAGPWDSLQMKKQALELLEGALALDREVMDGTISAWLGHLYWAAPGWPISFGDNGKSVAYLKRSIASHPDNIEAIYFYAAVLRDIGDENEARTWAQKGLEVPARAGHERADAGRRDQLSALLEDL